LKRRNEQRGDLGGISSPERLKEWDTLESPEGRLLAHCGSTLNFRTGAVSGLSGSRA
jgi:hypothetical protein